MKATYLYSGHSFNHSVNRLNCLHTLLKRNRRTYLVASVTSLIQGSLVQHWIRGGYGSVFRKFLMRKQISANANFYGSPITDNTHIFGKCTFGQCLDS
jgi:hypothetical protein